MNRFTAIPFATATTNTTNTIVNADDAYAFLDGKTILCDHRCLCRYRAVKTLLDTFLPYLAKRQMQICVAKSARAEIEKELAAPETDLSYRRSLQSGLQILELLTSADMIKLIGSENDSTEETFLKYIMLNRTGREIVVLTQQKWLFDDVEHLNALRTIQGHKVLVRRLNTEGMLEQFQLNQPQTAVPEQSPKLDSKPLTDTLARLGLL